MEIISFISNIVQIIISMIVWPFKKLQMIMKIKNVKIKQEAKRLEGINGVDINLENGKKLKLENIDVEQRAESMKDTVGMKIKASGKQEAELKNVDIKTPIGRVKISKGVTINKQPEK